MTQYGESSIRAYEYYKNGMSLDDAWGKAVKEIIKSKSGQKKDAQRVHLKDFLMVNLIALTLYMVGMQ